MRLQFDFQPGDLAQSATLRLGCESGQAAIVLDRPADRLDDLAEVAQDLAEIRYLGPPEGDSDERLSWEGESWEYRWEFSRRSWDHLTIDLFYTPDRHAGRGAELERVFHCRCDTAAFVRAVVAELEWTLLRFGFLRFRASRRYGEFPISRYFRLRAWLDGQDRRSDQEADRPHGESSLAQEIATLQALVQVNREAGTPILPGEDPAAPSTGQRDGDGDAEALELEFRLRDAGWATARIRAGDQEVTFGPGYLSHALGALSGSALSLLKPAEPPFPQDEPEAAIRWEGEPERLRWNFRRLSAVDVEITLHYSPDACISERDSWGNPAREAVVLRTRCSVRHYARQVLEQMEHVLLKHGLLGYRESWIDSEFPLSDYLKLRSSPAVAPVDSGPSPEPQRLRDELERLQALVNRSED